MASEDLVAAYRRCSAAYDAIVAAIEADDWQHVRDRLVAIDAELAAIDPARAPEDAAADLLAAAREAETARQRALAALTPHAEDLRRRRRSLANDERVSRTYGGDRSDTGRFIDRSQ